MNPSDLAGRLDQLLADAAARPPQGMAARCASDNDACPPEVRRLLAGGDAALTAGSDGVARDVARLVDHTLLKPEATEAQIRQLCDEARRFSFASVCVNPHWVALCAGELRNTESVVCTVIGFPLGATTTATKVAEAAEACRHGAREVDMVLNVGALRGGDVATVYEDIRAVAEAAHGGGARLKVIVETALLADDDKRRAAALCRLAGADFVKTSTGFAAGGATAADVALLRHMVEGALGVKASGGIRSLRDVWTMVEAGATRIGASAGARIVEQARTGSWDDAPSSSSY